MRKNKPDALAALRKEVSDEIRKRYPTVEQFCWDNDVNKATVSNFLHNKKDFRISTLVKIAEALGRELDVSLK